MAAYFEAFAKKINAPIRCGVNVSSVRKNEGGPGFIAETSAGRIAARYVVAATGPFQVPVIPPMVPQNSGVTQMHSRPPTASAQLPPGAVLVVGGGSSGAQIADELLRAGRRVYLSGSDPMTGRRGAIADATSCGGSVCWACGTPPPRRRGRSMSPLR